MDEVLVILGVRPYSFTDDKTGNKVEGVTLHTVNNRPEDEDVIGSLVERLSISNDIVKALILDAGSTDINDIVGLSVEPVYNKRGKVRHLVLVDNK